MSANRLIINIRGAGGSGKTTLMRHVLAHETARFEWEFDERPGGVRSTKARHTTWTINKCEPPGWKLPVYVQGRYHDRVTGGCDVCKDMDAIEKLIWRAAETLTDGHCAFEGMMVSGSAERWVAFSQRLKHLPPPAPRYLWLFLRPDKDELIRRVMERNGGHTPQVKYFDENIRKQERSWRFAKPLTPARMMVDLDWRLSPLGIWEQMDAVVRERERDG